jgi:PAS domain S-box-containing protein
MPPPQSSSAQLASADAGGPYGDKKQLKRDANRRSAQLSRKRKKQFIEELKEENDELRRKEQILKSIPDLIVVFDSAGKLWFVSHSVNRFVDFSPKELEGSSFWDRLCEESVRLLKAAFMDALAARKSDMDTTPLGSGVWELRLVDKDGSHKIVTLNGVVHFSGDTPECVCSIRPRDEKAALDKQPESFAEVQAPTLVSALPGRASITSAIKPHQSVIASTGGKEDSSVHFARGKAQAIRVAAAASGQPRRAAQISDGDSGSVVSESGSE